MQLEPIESLRARALAGDNDARVRMGNRYLAGVTVDKDPEEAKRWYLLAGDSAGSKLDKARELGVAIVDEAAFLKLVRGG